MQKQTWERFRLSYDYTATVAIVLLVPLIVCAIDVICWYALFGEVSEIVSAGNRVYDSFFFTLTGVFGSLIGHVLMPVIAVWILIATAQVFWGLLYPTLLASAVLVAATLLYIASGWSVSTCFSLSAPFMIVPFFFFTSRALSKLAAEIAHP